jgi:hypothetical protein
MHHTHDRGMATAEFAVGTLGAVMIASLLMRLGDPDGWFFRHLADLFTRALDPSAFLKLVRHAHLPFL